MRHDSVSRHQPRTNPGSLNLTTEIDLPKAFGLDFGTTNSALAHAAPDGTVRLAQFSGDATFRSVIYFDEDETSTSRKLRVVAGPDAIQSYLNAKTPGRLIQSTKSYLASRASLPRHKFSVKPTRSKS